MSGILGGLFNPQTPDQQANAAGLWAGLLNAGAAVSAASAPRVGWGARPTAAQIISQGGQAFAQGQQQGQQGFYQQQDQQAQRTRANDFTAATGTAEDSTLTPSQRALRAAIPAGQRGILGALGPQQGMQVLGGLLGRAPQGPHVVGAGGTLVGADGRPLFTAPERPPAAQWVGSPETGYGWATPPARGGEGQPAAPRPAMAGVAPPDAPTDALVAASAARATAVGQPLYNPAQARNPRDQDGNEWDPRRPGQPWDAGLPPPTGRINPNIGGGVAPPGRGFQPVIPPRAPRDNELVAIPDPSSPTGARYVPRSQAAGQPALNGSAPVAVVRRGPDGQDVPGSTEFVPGGQAAGRTPASQREDPAFERTRSLRTEFLQLAPVREFLQVRPQVQAIRSAINTDTGAADLDIVFAFAKMLDPTSVVREGEANSIVATGGMFDQLRAMAARVQGGGRLGEEVRRNLLHQAESRFRIYADNYDGFADQYRELAELNGLPADQVARSATGRPDASGRRGQAPQTPPPADAPPQPAAAPPGPPPAPQPVAITRATLRAMPMAEVRALAQRQDLTSEQRAALAADIERRARNIQMGRPE